MNYGKTFLILILMLLLTSLLFILNSHSYLDNTFINRNPSNQNILEVNETVLQDKNNNCGSAALKMIFHKYNINVSLQEIDANIELKHKGSTMLALKNYAKSKGLYASGWKLNIDHLFIVKLPAILFVNNNHYVVLDSVSSNHLFYVRDPAIGKMTLRRNDLMNVWTGIILLFNHDKI